MIARTGGARSRPRIAEVARGIWEGVIPGGHKSRPYRDFAHKGELPVGAALEAARGLQEPPENAGRLIFGRLQVPPVQ